MQPSPTPARDLRHSLTCRGVVAVLVGSLAVACGSTPDTGKSADAAQDRDGDGFFEGADCNDSDPEINPDAADAWYDGVDSDCAGDDDFDADLDGHRGVEFGGLDCDDTSADVSPDAIEVWYDGVDSDCAGDDDFDADLDGIGTDDSPADCDDTRADVYPGASETWYDGVDSDCAEDSDFDADADGFDAELYAADGAEGDCDDDDAGVFPGATEVWYDGIDGDCAGDDDFDADGDGEAAATGGGAGTDCDDADPSVFTGARERLDDADTDCDNVDDSFTTDQDVVGTRIFGAAPGDHLGTALAVGFADSDAFLDIAVVQGADTGLTTGEYGQLLLVDGAELASRSVTGLSPIDDPTGGDSAVRIIRTQIATGPIESVAFVGDYGTGTSALEEVVVGTPAYDDGFTGAVGAAWVVNGNLTANTTVAQATWRLIGEAADGEFGAVVMGDKDFDLDGDGLPETVVGAPGEGSGRVYIFESGSLGAVTGNWVASDADTILEAGAGGAEFGAAIAAGDFTDDSDAGEDSDGDAHLLISDPGANGGSGAVYMVRNSGVTILSGSIDSRLATKVVGSTGSEAGTAIAAGDTFQDGTEVQDELILGAPRAVTRAGQVQVFDGADVEAGGTLTVSDSVVQYTGSAINGFAGSAVASGGDLNGDGLQDFLAGGPGNSAGGAESGVAWVVLADPFRLSNQSLLNAAATIDGASAYDDVGSSLAVGDIDGDGQDDAIIGIPGEDRLGDEGGVTVLFSRYPAE